MTITKTLRQEIRQLKSRNARWHVLKTFVEGEKCIRELCQSSWPVERIYFTGEWKDADWLNSEPGASTAEKMEVSAKDMAMMSSMKTPPGILALTSFGTALDSEEDNDGMALFLDGVSDPGNVGTLIRVADWFGLARVILSPASADPFSPKALQSSMGSAFHLPIQMQKIEDVPKSYKSNVVGLDAGGTDMVANELNSPSLLIVGSESHGLSEACKAQCNVIASIPGAGRAESLNASVAGAIAIAHFVQQRVL